MTFETADRPVVTRRAMLGQGAAAFAGLAVGFGPSAAEARRRPARPPAPGGTGSPIVTNVGSLTGTPVGSWVLIGSDNTVTILCGSQEMGQGIMTGLAQVLAEELMVDWGQVKVEHAPAGAATYTDPTMRGVTGGSMSMRGYYQGLRIAGAKAREVLKMAAVARFGGALGGAVANAGAVTVNGQTASYGALAAQAALMTPPASPALLGNGRLIGRSVPRKDIPAKVDGSAVFGIDVRLPGMLYAAVKHSPVHGGTLPPSYMPAAPAGTLKAVNLGTAVAVVASNTWVAKNAVGQIPAPWIVPAGAIDIDSAKIDAAAQALMASASALNAELIGDAEGAWAGSPRKLELTYAVPFMAHATLEPLACTVLYKPGQSCEVWASTQAPPSVAAVVNSLTGLPASSILVHPMFMGGGMGRKFETDYVTEAVKIAMAVPGKPVKLTWTREEDMTHDFYRPTALSRVRVGLDANGQPTAWSNRIVSPSILSRFGVPNTMVDSQAVDGAIGLPYAFPSKRVDYVRHTTTAPVGFWRSVGHSYNTFVVESAVDEAAALAGLDPLAFRQRLLANAPSHRAVLDAAAALAGWSTPAPAGRARGLAMTIGFGSIVAQVAEVSVPAPGTLKVHRVSCAIDCGMAVNPDQVVAQMEGGIIQGLGAALWGRITFSNGRTVQRNYNNYRMLKMSETPQIAVTIVNQGSPIGGVGEPGVPCVAPAVANAYARLTGTRIRTLPFFPDAGTMGEADD